MPIYEYEALTRSGLAMRGSLEAASLEEATTTLGGMAMTVQTVQRAPSPMVPRLRISRTEFMLFNQQLASITKAGIPLERGLRELASDVESKPMRKLVTTVADELEAGAPIDEVFEKHKGQVPPLYGQILTAGLKSGRLGEMLISLNRHMEMASLTRRLLVEALTYPVVVLLLAAGLMTFFFHVLVPQFEGAYEAFGNRLPDITLLMLSIAHNVGYFWMAAGIGLGAAIVAAGLLSISPAGRRIKERILMRVPILGQIFHLGVLSRLSDAMATLVGAGSDMPSCLRLGAMASGSELAIQSAETIAKHVEAGTPLMEAGEDTRLIPRLFLYSMEIGARRNELQDSLFGLSEMYRRQVQMHQARMQAMLLPMLLVIMGLLIGGMLVALFMPMTNMLQSVGGL